MAFQAMNHGQDAHVTSYGKGGVMCDRAAGAQGEAMMRSNVSRGGASAFTGAYSAIPGPAQIQGGSVPVVRSLSCRGSSTLKDKHRGHSSKDGHLHSIESENTKNPETRHP